MAESKASERAPISVVVPVKNEEANIRNSLDHLQWVDEVFVVDSQSTDKTVEFAEEYDNVKIVQFHYDGGWPKKGNWAFHSLPHRNEWLMILGCDEFCSDELRKEIEAAIQNPEVNGYYMRWKFIFLGGWMKHCWSHGWMLRLFRKGTGQYEDLGMRGQGGWDMEVHENIVVEGASRRLGGTLCHQSYDKLERWIRKQNEFSTWNAIRRMDQLRQPLPSLGSLFSSDALVKRKYLKAFFIRMPFRPIVLFFWLYVVKLGVLDGKAGFYFCMLRAVHEFNISAKVFEMRQEGLKKQG
jgi:glycosyltransferase involved in cell wall biosynthesis